MADIDDRLTGEARRALREAASRTIEEHLVADAPADLDEVMDAVPVAPGWVRLLLLVAAVVFSWALIIFLVVGLVMAVCSGPSKPKAGRRGLSAAQAWRRPSPSGLAARFGMLGRPVG